MAVISRASGQMYIPYILYILWAHMSIIVNVEVLMAILCILPLDSYFFFSYYQQNYIKRCENRKNGLLKLLGYCNPFFIVKFAENKVFENICLHFYKITRLEIVDVAL